MHLFDGDRYRLLLGQAGFFSVLIGGAVAMMNAVGTAFAWPRLLEKKDVALALSIIVSKYALSIGIFYWLTLESAGRTLNGIWFGDRTIALGSASGTLIAFAFGLASVVPAALIVAARDLFGTEDAKSDSKDDSRDDSENDSRNRGFDT